MTSFNPPIPPTASPPARGTVRTGPVTAIPAVMKELGVPLEPVFERAGVRLPDFTDPETRLPQRTLGHLAHDVARRADCPQFGVLVGARFSLSGMGAIGDLLRHAPTVGRALRAFASSYHVQDSAATPVLVCRPGYGALLGYATLRQDATALRYIYDAAAGILFRMLRELCGPAFHPRAIELAYARPAEPGFYRDFFDCKVSINASLTGVLFDERWLAQPLANSHPSQFRELLDRIAHDEHHKGLPWTQRTEHALQQLLLGGTATAPAVAALLHLSERSLRRKLDGEGQRFRDLLARRRFEYAQQLLRDTDLAIGDIAMVLQYQDANAFSRAFRAWADCPPTDWRLNNAPGRTPNHS
jgi:AraC-like DNA-binding protein